jgi:hypothetical protein
VQRTSVNGDITRSLGAVCKFIDACCSVDLGLAGG